MNLKTHSGDLGFDTFLPDEFVEDPLDPFCRWSRPFDDALLVETYPVHHNDHSSVIHDPDHSRKDPLQPLAKALEIKGFLKAGDLKYRATVDEQLVNLAGLFTLRVRQTDAQILRVNPGQCPNKGLALVGYDADVFLEQVGQLLHELAARSRRHLSLPTSREMPAAISPLVQPTTMRFRFCKDGSSLTRIVGRLNHSD